MPRKTSRARFRRTMSSSDKRPTRFPILVLGMVITLSTIMRHRARKPFLSFGSIGMRNKTALPRDSVVKGQTLWTSWCRIGHPVRLRPGGACLRNPCRQQPSKSRPVSLLAPNRDRVDESLIVLLLGAICNQRATAGAPLAQTPASEHRAPRFGLAAALGGAAFPDVL